MIKNKQDYLYYLEADRIAKSVPPKRQFKEFLKDLLFPDLVWVFQKTLRRYEYYKNCRTTLIDKLMVIFIIRKFKRLSYKLGFTIPINVFGPGLSIAHYGTIVVNDGVRIGENCRIHTGVNIGTEAGYSNKTPTLGNNCYIAPGVKIYGEIEIGNNVAIAANSVVNKSFLNENIAIGGAPAKKISDLNVYNLIIPATLIIEKGYNIEDISGIPARELQQRLNLELKTTTLL